MPDQVDPHPRRSPEVQAQIDEAMRRADENADGRWKHIFDACILMAATKHYEVTVDEVLEELRRCRIRRKRTICRRSVQP
jgi:hypothetical protein